VITITKIIGESFNLETGEEHSSAVEISNGISSRLIAVSPSAIPAIVELFVQVKEGAHRVTARRDVTQGELVAGVLDNAILSMEDEEEDETAESPFDPDNTDWPEDEGPQEPLDAYEDEDTGVGSI
jgi:hypothetical protein